jgi:PEP-CTERM motif
MRARFYIASIVTAALLGTCHANAGDVTIVNTGDPDGKIATGSRPSSAGKIEIESADDFILSAENLDPDWLRVGTDITGQGPFNAAFSLSGQAVPEPSSLVLLASGGFLALGLRWVSHRRLRARRQPNR